MRLASLANKAALASQVSGSKNRFNSFGGISPLMLLLDGYVVLMNATMPVVGDPKTVSDSFIEQISANAQAIIDRAVELGVSQRDRMVVGGYSYGAFMSANLLGHADLFKADNGGQVRYISLPHEGHGYTARESQGHVLWEMSEWMKRQVGAP